MQGSAILDHVMAFTQALAAQARRFKFPLLVAALLVFAGGLIVSVSSLDLSLSDLALLPLLLLLFVLSPLTLAYSAINLQLMAKALGLQTGFWHGVRVSAYAQVAELLPIPGGAIVRTAALRQKGGKLGASSLIVLSFSLLWIACAAVSGGVAILGFEEEPTPALHLTAIGLLAFGGVTIIAMEILLMRRAGAGVALAALVYRIVGLMLIAARIFVAFAIMGLFVEPVSSLLFAFATILGSAASLVPSGLGIAEALSAALAELTGTVAPAAAFLAIAINRICGLLVNMTAALFALAFHCEATPTKVVNNGLS